MRERVSKLIEIMNKFIIVVLLLLAIFNIVAPFFILNNNHDIYIRHLLSIHLTIKRLFSFIILIVVWKLYKRLSAAWTITMIALSGMIFEYLHMGHIKVWNPWFITVLTVYIVLLFSKNYYCRRMDRYSLKKGIIIYLIYAVFVFLNSTVALITLKEKGMVHFSECIKQTVDVMFYSDNVRYINLPSHFFYTKFIFWFSWICILIGLVLVLTPCIARIHNQQNIEKARKLVQKYGQNCSSYLTLENDKIHYFGKSVEGFIAYGIVKDTIVVLGEPICAPKNFLALLSEFKNYCERNAYNLLFLTTSSMFLEEYSELGMGMVKCGEEPRFRLSEYSLAGGKASKIRLNINHATKAGIKILEYEPLKKRNTDIEKKIMSISEEWLTMKKSSELVFTMGGIGFDNPMDRRYFYAVNAENNIEGFIVFVPFGGMNGYMTDVTRHGKNATRGVMEKIFYEAMMKFKEEGIEWGSLSLAPLARLEEEPYMAAKVLNMIYEKMNHVYGFKTLYQTKLKYNPTYWEPSYYVYSTPTFTPALAYAIIRIQNPLGTMDYVKAFFYNMLKERKEKKRKGLSMESEKN
ncbi:bifunctional lysylphosphatidylglycerol flippase/synthetase MprF [Anaeromicropila herbilytica]|uniref:Phosphatidylglycerol lysyltransferase C-terminal domain-containing protein n=1 Tax=Anaeromicropila herbilytica TaxID=2785025 RepID=A0A7R7EIF7_9FIRM|nr:DUF2156 domain-containing protein [Anaeromicropila herbilytica]BCN29367.1 hypothetical protein bsdtb5_06620 [Anaeromicropila herbilytica]